MFLNNASGRAWRLIARPHRLRRVRGFLRYRAARRELTRIVADMDAGQDLVSCRPVYLTLETGAVCNLRCPYCVTGARQHTLPKEFLTPEVFEAIARHLPMGSLFEANLFNWGEPLLNPHLAQYIAWFARHGLQTTIHVNFSAKDYDDAYLDELVRSGLAHLVVSLDGASQGSYEKYRAGGDFVRVLRNMENLARIRAQSHSETPKITYKMLLNRFNQDEIEEARRIAAGLSAEFWLCDRFDIWPEARGEWLAEGLREKYGEGAITATQEDSPGRVTTECRQLWDTLSVGSNGDVFACCLVYHGEHAVGNLVRDSFETIWNGERMRALRRFVLENGAETPNFPNTCTRCPSRFCLQKQRNDGEN